MVTNIDIRALSWGPKSKPTSWHRYFVNGYKFHTKSWSDGKKTKHCGVPVKGITEGGEDDFYGIIQHIFELEYSGLCNKITLFYCDWFDPKRSRGTQVHLQYNIVDIKMSRWYDRYDPFILAQKARQVYYVPYPEMCKVMRGWYAAITTKPRGHVEVDGIEDEFPYQANEMPPVLPITEDELVRGLLGDTTNEFEQVVDSYNYDSMDQDAQTIDTGDASTENNEECWEDEEEEEWEDEVEEEEGDDGEEEEEGE